MPMQNVVNIAPCTTAANWRFMESGWQFAPHHNNEAAKTRQKRISRPAK